MLWPTSNCLRRNPRAANKKGVHVSESDSVPQNIPQATRWGASHFLVVGLLFFFSGLSSLIYQVIWTRELVFVFGSTSFASSTVLSAFMGGLGLGSYFAGKYCDRMKNPFLWYGILEAGIGVWALLVPFLLDAAIPFYKIFWQAFHSEVLVFSLVRFAVVALILLPPTVFMGATLPLLARFIISSLSIVGNRVGFLYSINTCGAVFGAVTAGFMLIPSLGLNLTNLVAAIINFLLGLVVYLLQAKWSSTLGIAKGRSGLGLMDPVSNSTESDAASSKVKEKLPRGVFWTMIAFGFSGGLAMLHEVAWTRALLLIIGSTTFAFTIMLSTFLIGIFVGSLILSRFVDNLKAPLLWFSIFQLGLCGMGLLSIHLFNYLPYWNLVTNATYWDNPDAGMAVRFALTSCVLFPITVCLGAIFPLAVKICTRDLEAVGRSVGTLYSINTLGAIVGAFIAGFAIIPAIGSEQTLLWACVGNGIIGSALLISFATQNMAIKVIAALVSTGLVVWTSTAPSLWNLRMVTSSQKTRRLLQIEREPFKTLRFEDWLKQVESSFDILFWKDGMCSNVAVIGFKDKGISLLTNGHIDASDRPSDMRTQALLPTIPLLIKTGAKDVGDIGWGSGSTMGYALLFPIKKMVCAEIEPAVIETSPFFHSVNLAPEKDKRLIININDGRNYMMATNETFDVIISEPSNPWQAGVCNLYTQEYFRVCHDRLKPGGIFTMWWQYNEVSSDNLSRVFSSLKKVYKHVVVFQIDIGDVAAFASDEPIRINLKDVAKALSEPKLNSTLALYTGIRTPEDLAARCCLSDESISKIAAKFPPNTDDKNHIEFDVARTYEQKNFSKSNSDWLIANSGPLWDVVDWGTMSPKEKSSEMALIAESALRQKLVTSSAWAAESYRVFPNPKALSIEALMEAQRGNFEGAIEKSDEALNKFPKTAELFYARAIVELMSGAPLKARADLEKAVQMAATNKVYKLSLAQTYLPKLHEWYQIAISPILDSGVADTNHQKIIELLEPTLKDEAFIKENVNALAYLAAAMIALDRPAEGTVLMERYLKVKPGDRVAISIISDGYRKTGNTKKADQYAAKANQLNVAEAQRLAQSASILVDNQRLQMALELVKRSLKLDPKNQFALAILRKLAETDASAKQFLKEISSSSP